MMIRCEVLALRLVKKPVSLLCYLGMALLVPVTHGHADDKPQGRIQPVAGGIFELPAATAALLGPSVCINDKTDVAASWKGPDDRAVWTLENAEPGPFGLPVIVPGNE